MFLYLIWNKLILSVQVLFISTSELTNIDFYKGQCEKKEENYVYSKNKKYFRLLQSCFADCQSSKKQQNSDVNISTPTNINNRYKDVIQLISTVGNYSKRVVEIEKKRFQYVDLSSVQIKISLEDWKKMTVNRSMNRFGSYYYSEILLPKLKVLYNCFVPCIANHYLRKPEKVTKLRDAREKYYDVDIYYVMLIYIVAMHTAVTVRCLEKFLFIRMNIA